MLRSALPLSAALLLAGCDDAGGPALSGAGASADPKAAGELLPLAEGLEIDFTTEDLTCGGEGEATVTLKTETSGEMDVVFALDSSGSISSDSFEVALDWMEDIVLSALTVSPDGHRVAVVQFATGAQLEYSLADTQSASSLVAAISALPHLKGSTYTKDGVSAALAEVKANARPGVPRLLVLVTDGVPNPATTQSPCDLAASLASESITVVVIGVGSDFKAEPVECLVKDPAADIIEIDAYEDLAAVTDFIGAARDITFTADLGAGFDLTGDPTATAGAISFTAASITWTVDDSLASSAILTVPYGHDAAAAPGGGTLNVLENAEVAYEWEDAERVEELADMPADVLTCDATPPAIKPVVSGDLGDDGWYVSDVELAWDVVDPESAVTGKSGCDAVTVTADAAGETYTCTATSAGGKAEASITIKRDATDPTVTLDGASGVYDVDETVEITCGASDAMSGLADSDCPDGSAPAWTYGPGKAAVTAWATDNAGNYTEVASTFEVVASFEGLCALTQAFSGKLGLAVASCARLEAAAAAAEPARSNQIDAFIKGVSAQSGKGYEAWEVDVLLAFAKQL